LITLIKFGEAYKSWSSSLCNLLQSPATSCLLSPNLFLRTCSQTSSVYVRPSMWETKFHTHKTGKIMDFNNLIFKVLERRREGKIL
jgi:hypothetical protein